MNIRHVFVFACLGLFLANAAPARAIGIGAMGDSYADEYEFYPPDRSTARNFVEILSALDGANFGPFTSVSRGAPRDQGFAYDWALTDTTTADLSTQAAGLATQVTSGQVNYALVFSGGNDFRNALSTGQTSPAQFSAQVASMLTNVESAISTLTAAGNVKVVVSDLPDVQFLPETQGAILGGIITQQQADNASVAEAAYNTALKSHYSGNPDVAVYDAASAAQSFLLQPSIVIDGVTLDPLTPADDYHSVFLADGVHLGTIAQGELFANGFVNTLDASFSAGIAPLTDQQIVDYARQIQAQAVPLPPALLMALPVLAGAGIRRWTIPLRRRA